MRKRTEVDSVRQGGAEMTIQDLYEWANENDVLNEPVSVPDKYDEWTFAEGMEIKEAHGSVEIRIW